MTHSFDLAQPVNRDGELIEEVASATEKFQDKTCVWTDNNRNSKCFADNKKQFSNIRQITFFFHLTCLF